MEIIFSLANINGAATWFIEAIKGYSVIAIHGEMGAGKTTFISAVCRQLGVKEPISSPTFSIINEYSGNHNTIYHLDLFRLSSEMEAQEAGVEDCITSGNLCFVEWPEKLPHFFNNALHCYLEVVSNDSRKIRINA
ncbi:MAG: tRNA (adenosine(37)-N6)-threonylcarbamoyltransferase complex ATPase subunit type 1 TsaE [Ferruginibacter sp.]|nr:tRNA (adenosine(37)-N6)-threonylcarbamoyltransferase complex ATPase subunit type 1 TsaE [Ferruginibacter sp.]